MEASTCLSIQLRGHVQTLGEYHQSHRSGTHKTSNDFETERNRQPNKYRYQSRFMFGFFHRKRLAAAQSCGFLTEWLSAMPSIGIASQRCACHIFRHYWSHVSFRHCWYLQKKIRFFTWTGRGIKWPVQRRKKKSLERGPRGEWGPGRTARARQKSFSLENLLACARARRAQGTFHAEDPFKGNCVIEAFSVGGGGIQWPAQQRMCFFRGFTWTGHFIEAFSVGGRSIKWQVQHRLCFFRWFYLDWPLYRDILCWGGIKWPVQHRLCFFQEFYLDCPLYRGILCWGRGIKWPVQHRLCFFFRGFTWTGHFIEAFSVGRGYKVASPA